jgi:signal transduction histidine kinase
MRRIRLTILLVSLALALPVGMLVWRTLEGLALERAVRHQALAERTFDEMERALSRILEREEARSPTHYRFYLEASGERSPLAAPLAEDFVIGAFQVDPDGSLHTPLRPRDIGVARSRGDWPPNGEVARAIDVLTRVVGDVFGPNAAAKDGLLGAAEKKAGPDRQAPGTTQPVVGPLADKRESPARRDAESALEDDATAYDLLQSLNRAADVRKERRKQVARAPRGSAYAPRVPEAVAEPEPRSRQHAGLRSTAPLAPSPARRPAESFSAMPADEAMEFEALEEGMLAKADRDVAPPPIPLPRLAVEPMVGRAAGPGHLVLYRTLLVGQQGYRQGLVLDRDRLGDWLAREVIGGSGLSRVARVSFDAADVPREHLVRDGAWWFEHRFAEPFDGLTARLRLAALGGVGSPDAVYALVGLLLAVGAVGLYAIHRTASVTVQFAERRSNFVSAVTHELKTPLTAIRMYAEMLRDGIVSSDLKRDECYATITDESERLSRLIDNVLEFSRLERGRREMSWTVGPVGPVLGEAAETLRPHAESEGFSLQVEVEPGLPAVRFDRDALLQVLFNLVDNAMKYARQASSRTVVLAARNEDGRVVVAVRDFGPGVPPRHLKRIFEPFYRSENELTRSAKGTGIGLALVKELAESMGAGVRGTNPSDGGFRVDLSFAPERGVA